MSSIMVDVKINKGSPSVTADNGGHCTVKQVVVFVDAFTKMEDPDPIKATSEELGLNQAIVHECLAYRDLYPQIME